MSERDKRKVRLLVIDYPPDAVRPKTRGDCADGPRPCPWVSCRHHLYLSVDQRGTVRLEFPGQEVDEIEHTCSLDLADRGERTLEEVGQIMGLTRERARQIEAVGMMRMENPMLPFADFEE